MFNIKIHYKVDKNQSIYSIGFNTRPDKEWVAAGLIRIWKQLL